MLPLNGRNINSGGKEMTARINRLRKRSRKFFVLVLTFVFFSSVCRAQDPNVDLMKKLYTKIGLTVGVGSNDPIAGESYLVLANPGILLDPNLDIATTEGRFQLAKLLDRVLTPSWIYRPNADNTLKVYSTILNTKEVPDFSLNQAQKKQLDDARKVIFKDIARGVYSDAYKAYLEKRKKLSGAIKNVEDYRKANPGQSVPADMLDELSAARDEFALIVNKNKIIAAKNVINTLEHADPNVWWGELQGRFDDNTETFNNTQFPIYNLFPSYPVWLDKTRSWTKFDLSQQALEQTTSNSHSSVGGGLSVGWGFWSVGADYSHQENRTFFQLNANHYNVKMELMRVSIDRPWLDDYVFKSRAWQWQSSSPLVGNMISDGGDATRGITPRGVMPFLPTGLLLARNVSLSGDWTNDLKTTFDQQTSAGASIGFGPFSFGGRTENSDSSTYRKANAAGNTVSWDAAQIIGFFVEVLPKNPDRNKCLHFASDTTPPPPECTPSGGPHVNINIANLIGESTTAEPPAERLLNKARNLINYARRSRARRLRS
jgi:hypothetical protein